MEMTTQLVISTNPWADSNHKITVDSKEIKTEDDVVRSKDRLAEIAKNELREDESTRKQCLQQLRDWIAKNEDIENCLTSDKFLLRFLRVKKFSMPMAEQTLLKYLNFRKRFSYFMTKLDCQDKKMDALISNGYIFASPFRDDYGRRVIIYDLGKFDPHKYTGEDMCRAHAITYETILEEEENQILGVNHVADLGGATPAFLGLFSIPEFATIIRWGEQSYAVRHKEFNLLNMPSGLRYVYEFIQSSLRNQKLRDRIVIHKNLEELSRKVNRDCLPKELGGIMPASDMIQLWKEELTAKRDILLSFDSMNLLSDRGIIRRRNPLEADQTGIGSLPGSFRKLEVD